MGLPQIVSRNTTQQNIGASAQGRVTNAATGLYTVPAGKTTKLTSASMTVDTVGSDATYALAILDGSTYSPISNFVAVGPLSLFNGLVIMTAGQILTNVGDSGATNGTVDLTITYIEL